MKRDELLNNESVRQKIAERAYFLSESNGFAPGRETEFWLTAEEEILSSAAPTKKVVRKAAAKVVTEAPVIEAPAKPAAPRKKTAKKVLA